MVKGDKKDEGAKVDTKAKKPEAPSPKKPEPRGGIDDLKRIVAMIERAVETNQTRLIGRAMRHNAPLRHNATKELLSRAVKIYIPEGMSRMALEEQLATLPDTVVEAVSKDDKDSMEVDEQSEEVKEEEPDVPKTTVIPEVEVYISLLVLTTLMSQGSSHAQKTAEASAALFQTVQTLNRRSLDLLRSKVFHYFSLSHERHHGNIAALRPTLLEAHRMACLQHDEIGQATLLNLLLRSLLEENQVEQAYKLVSKTNFPEKASNNQFCRYLYYTGRISALQLEYGDAHEKLKSSLRKAPQNAGVADFRRTVQKLLVIVSLLMGEVPDRSTFGLADYRVALAPYLALTIAVREGNLVEFNKVVAEHRETFIADKMLTLVIRLSHSVIKTGLRRINLSYSRISMVDICNRLALDSPTSAESVCAKAIRDGVIDAVIDHEQGWLTSKERSDVYATNEPQRAFHQRVEFCLAVRNEAVKAMRYPADAFKPKPKKKESAESDKSPEELAKEIEEELEEDEM
jgi:26S proteasome regulatory subunit N3